MHKWDINEFIKLNKTKKSLFLSTINNYLEKLTAEQRINWALKNLPEQKILSSSFGIQSIVSLHLLISKKMDIPIIFIDTGYLFPETYMFVDKLTKDFNLNLNVFSAKQSSAWQEARYGKLWEQGLNGIKLYNKINKIEPMNRALLKLKVHTWFAGLRREQSDSRANLLVLSVQKNIFKFFPIVDWDNQKINFYIKKNNLDYHRLSKLGYVSLGDIHTTSKLKRNMREEDTRFFGLKRECGLHEY